jgi:ATP-dependent Clp protease ATP-binding subunit ClpA
MVFSSPVVAVECALSIQKEFYSHKILRVRIGMDMGEVKQVLDDKLRDIFGIKVSTASRITGAAFGGHVLASKAIWEDTQKRITNKSICWKYLGSRSFKPGEPTIDIYEVYHSNILKNPMDHLPEIMAGVEKKSKLFSTSTTPYLDKFGRDLSKEARDGNLGPFTGRRSELLQIIQSLSQKYSNNPLLIGRAGVGKTSLIEALAIRIANAKDSESLSKKRIISLNLKHVLAGTKNRYEFEELVIKVIDEAQAMDKIIVFIDEIHNYIGIGTPDSQVNVANIINPRILEGKLQIIGTTTETDFNRYMKIDASLERGFQKLIIKEPSQRETLQMLKIFRKKLEEFHRIWITDRALEAAISLSNKFEPDNALPAKAIDILDEAGAQIHIPDLSMISEKKQTDLGVAHTVLNILSIAKVLSQRTGVTVNEIMASIGD